MNDQQQETQTKKNWSEFRESGMLFFINTVLHFFGWAIVFEMKDGLVTDVYPARVKYRGFSEPMQDIGHAMVGKYLAKEAAALKQETE